MAFTKLMSFVVSIVVFWLLKIVQLFSPKFPAAHMNKERKISALVQERTRDQKKRFDPKGKFFQDIDRLIGKDVVGPTATYLAASGALSQFVKQGHLSVDDLLRSNSEKLLWMHAEVGSRLDGGMQIRYTVQFNLFAGTVANLGSAAQRQFLQDEILSKGEIGCFALTERAAGVLSGLIVGTTATFVKSDTDGQSGSFVFDTPDCGAEKVWVSQGLMAKYAVVIARLMLPDSSKKISDKGPHAFLIDLVDLEKCGTIVRKDMPRKTAFNSLDNGYLTFQKAKVPHSALLCGIVSVNPHTGEYKSNNEQNTLKFEEVAQRLLSGRIGISLAAVNHLNQALINLTEKLQRTIITGRNQETQEVEVTAIQKLPFFRDVLDQCQLVMTALNFYCQRVADEYTRATLDNTLVKKVNAAKIVAVTFSIQMMLKLKLLVGAYSLQEEGPFGSPVDVLYVYQFAEGDAGILKQKMAKDCLTGTKKNLLKFFGSAIKDFSPKQLFFNSSLLWSSNIAQVRLLLYLAHSSSKNRTATWLENHRDVESVAWGESIRVIRETLVSEGLKNSAELGAFDEYFNV